ncbi:ABC transporter permease [Stieleria varia]|uniref:ABC transporter permease n=1 Tax=Stieleria varia TaxID=2528005 RepID=UPI00313E5BE5
MTESVSKERSLQLRNLTVRAGNRVLLSHADVTLPAGKITVIVGGSGAGKSVLLRILAGLLPRDGDVISWTGTIRSEEHDSETGDTQIIDDPRVGIVFQQFALFDELSPTANVQFAIDHRSDRKAKPEQTAAQWLNELGVPAKTPIAGLSGGQKQRLAIARTLAADPDVLLYDEPTSGLDAASGRKVAELIRSTQSKHHRTSVVVTHDYETLIPIADNVLLLDSETRELIPVAKDDWEQIPQRMRPVALQEEVGVELSALTRLRQSISTGIDEFLTTTGGALAATWWLPVDLRPMVPRVRWATRFFAHYLRLVGGPSAWVYLVLAGLIVGFTGTYFTFRFLPFKLYTQPLLIDELLASIGFALYRILVPVLATILVAARCGAAVAADVGVKRYGGQVDAMRTLGVQPRAYLLLPIVLAFVVATPILEWMAFQAAQLISLISFTSMYPDVGPYFWDQHFFRNLVQPQAFGFQSFGYRGWEWVLLKNITCGVGTAVIGYHQGVSLKQSASDVSHSITSTVLWTTLYVLIVHFLIALLEF